MAHEFIIAVAGQMGSGKSTLATELCQVISADRISFGAYVRSEAVARGLNVDVPSLQTLGEKMIAEMGVDTFVSAVLRVASGQSAILVVDGVRNIDVWHALKAAAIKSVLVYIETPDDVRRRRLLDAQKLGSGSLDLAMSHPLELGALKLRTLANINVSGESPTIDIARLIGDSLVS